MSFEWFTFERIATVIGLLIGVLQLWKPWKRNKINKSKPTPKLQCKIIDYYGKQQNLIVTNVGDATAFAFHILKEYNYEVVNGPDVDILRNIEPGGESSILLFLPEGISIKFKLSFAWMDAEKKEHSAVETFIFHPRGRSRA